MAASKRGTKARNAGITHFPLEREKQSQKRVPPRGATKGGRKAAAGESGHGHRLSRAARANPSQDMEARFDGKGSKGGKSGGSRAGLRSTGRKKGTKRPSR
ncbi:MAG TPA: hypothetical protein VFS39_00370 [Nitrospira sp.]|nr:hypothetical protein [Nitrospira sp.]